MDESEPGRLVATIAALRELRDMGATSARVVSNGMSVEATFAPPSLELADAPPGETVEEKAVREKREYEATLFQSVDP